MSQGINQKVNFQISTTNPSRKYEPWPPNEKETNNYKNDRLTHICPINSHLST